MSDSDMVDGDMSYCQCDRETSEEPEPSRQAKRPKTSRSCRAGLIFPVGRIDRFIRRGEFGERVGAGASVYMAAVLQYLTYDILDISGNVANGDHRRRIAPQHIQRAISSDSELHSLFGDVDLPQGKAAAKKPSATSSGKGRGKKSGKAVRSRNVVAA